MKDLLYKNEKPLFTIAAIISIFFWTVLILGTLGIALLYVLFFFIFYLFAQSALISYIKGTAVRLSPEQFPELYEQIKFCSGKIGLDTIPDTYILHADGAFNAFATRFLGRHFVVLFSDVVDALESNRNALNFYIGHELGHIQRKHLVWGPILFPAMLFPLLGAAYSRAREYTCDNFGFACCENPKDAEIGLSALCAGASLWKTLNVGQYAAQAEASGGFWMSFNELVSDYPWLVKRMASISLKASGEGPSLPGHHPLAVILAFFIPRTGSAGGAGSIMVTIAIIGILAAIAIPNFIAYRDKAAMMSQMINQESYEDSSDEESGPLTEEDLITELFTLSLDETTYFEEHGKYADNLKDIDFSPDSPEITVEIVSADEKCYEAVARIQGTNLEKRITCDGFK